LDFNTYQWTCAAIAAVCIGAAKSGVSGLGMAGILLMAGVFPPRESTGVILPMLLAADLFACGAFRHHVQWRPIWRLLPPALAGVIVGTWAMQKIPESSYRAAIGWIVLLMVGLQMLKMIFRDFSPALFQRWPFAASMGVIAGVTTMMANAAGPVMGLYLIVIKLPKLEFVATSAFFFLAINILKLPFSAGQGLITGPTLLFNLLLVPAIALGTWLGRKIVKRISQRLFEWLIVVGSVLAASRLILG